MPALSGLTLASLCTGSGMLANTVAYAFEAEHIWGIDHDPVAMTIADYHLGSMYCAEVEAIGDYTDRLQKPDIICCGWPCQPFSQAGKRKGHHDHRAIWPAIGRAIRLLRPRWLVLENVPGILASGEFARVADTLADCGYDFRWTSVRAAEAGAPHRRERVFILGCHERFPKRAGLTAPLIPPVRPLHYLVPTPCASDGAHMGRAQVREAHSVRLPDFVLDADRMRQARPALSRWRNISRRMPPAVFDTNLNGGVRISVAYVEWLMGWPQGWVTDVPRPPGGWIPGKPRAELPKEYALRILGNGVVPQQVLMALGRLFNYREKGRVYGIE